MPKINSRVFSLLLSALVLQSCWLDTSATPSPLPSGSPLPSLNPSPTVSPSPSASPLVEDPIEWTHFQPSADSRILYVSNDGDDASGRAYALSELTDPFNPGEVLAFSSFAAAKALSREGYPDWILLRRGDTFSANISARSGRSVAEPSLIGAWGAEGSLPILSPLNIQESALTIGGNTHYAAIADIDFYARTRDPAISAYAIDGVVGFSIVSWRPISNILLEGCRFRFFAGNIIQATDTTKTAIQDICLRRCLISDNYSNGSGHSQGLYAGFIHGLRLEENVFDHNGWYSQAPDAPGTATMFNHNTYFEDCHDVSFTGNVFSRGSSIGNKFTANSGVASSSLIRIRDNLYLDGEIGIGLGGNTVLAYRFHDIQVIDNVFTEIGRSQPTNRDLGWGLDATGWDSGIIAGNLFAHFSNANVNTVYGIRIEGGSRDINVENNIVYNLNPHGNSLEAQALVLAASNVVEGSSNINISGNIFQESLYRLRAIQCNDSEDLGGFNLSANSYYNPESETAFYVDGSLLSMSAWKTLSGDSSVFAEFSFPEPSRSVAAYAAGIGAGSSIESFIQACRAQSRFNWSENLKAATVNDWLRAGFGR